VNFLAHPIGNSGNDGKIMNGTGYTVSVLVHELLWVSQDHTIAPGGTLYLPSGSYSYSVDTGGIPYAQCGYIVTTPSAGGSSYISVSPFIPVLKGKTSTLGCLPEGNSSAP
jgi:hypothetical protein